MCVIWRPLQSSECNTTVVNSNPSSNNLSDVIYVTTNIVQKHVMEGRVTVTETPFTLLQDTVS